MKPSLGQYISVEEHKRRLRQQYQQRNSLPEGEVILGDPRVKRKPLSETGYDQEVEYQVTDPEVLAEMNGVQEPKAAQGIKVNVRRNNQMIDEAQRQFEQSKAAAQGQRWQGQERWQGHENEAMRKVNVLHCRRFVALMEKAGVRIWLNNFSKLGRIGVNARVLDYDELGRVAGWVDKTVTTLHYPWGYEWSVMRFNEYNVPTQEKFRGWRTALLVLISMGVCTEAQAHEAFGEPTLGPASEFYREQLFNLRNLKGMFERPVAVNAPSMLEHLPIRHVPAGKKKLPDLRESPYRKVTIRTKITAKCRDERYEHLRIGVKHQPKKRRARA